MTENYFESIDAEAKAYWLGFIWCDGYVAKQKCRFSISLKKSDEDHIKKFLNAICCDKEYKTYNYSNTAYKSNEPYVQLNLYNKEFCTILREKYGIIPYRSDCSLIIKNIPDKFSKDFIRGILDADGSFSKYSVIQNGYICNKYAIRFGCNEDILRYIEQNLIAQKCINNVQRKLYKRHKEDNRDGEYRNLDVTGRPQVVTTLSYLYNDANCYLQRKYEKYLNIINN